MAGIAEDSAYDASTSLAVSAAVNAADAILLIDVGGYSQAEEHAQAVSRLRSAGRSQAARHLGMVLALKNKAQYEPRRCTARDATEAFKHSQRLVDFAVELAATKGIQK